MESINCYLDKLKPQKFSILWIFLFLISLSLVVYGYVNSYNFIDVIKFIAIIILESITLRLMPFFYNLFFQEFLKKIILPIKIEFNRLNLSCTFREEQFLIETNEILQVRFYLNNYYYLNNYEEKEEFINKIRKVVNSIWRNTISKNDRYRKYLSYIISFCFLCGLILLFEISIFELYISTLDEFYKKIHIVVVFFLFSFWLYSLMSILFHESRIELPEFFERGIVYFSNSIVIITEDDVKKKNELLNIFINISSAVGYMSFITILSIIF